MSDGSRHQQSHGKTDAQSSSRSKSELDKILNNEPKGNYKVVGDGKHSGYRINGICNKLPHLNVKLPLKDPRKFNKKPYLERKVTRFKTLAPISHTVISFTSIYPQITKEWLHRTCNQIFGDEFSKLGIYIFRSEPPIHMAFIEFPSLSEQLTFMNKIFNYAEKMYDRREKLIIDELAMKIAHAYYTKTGKFLPPSKRLLKVDNLAERHRRIDLACEYVLPAEYYHYINQERYNYEKKVEEARLAQQRRAEMKNKPQQPAAIAPLPVSTPIAQPSQQIEKKESEKTGFVRVDEKRDRYDQSSSTRTRAIPDSADRGREKEKDRARSRFNSTSRDRSPSHRHQQRAPDSANKTRWDNDRYGDRNLRRRSGSADSHDSRDERRRSPHRRTSPYRHNVDRNRNSPYDRRYSTGRSRSPVFTPAQKDIKLTPNKPAIPQQDLTVNPEHRMDVVERMKKIVLGQEYRAEQKPRPDMFKKPEPTKSAPKYLDFLYKPPPPFTPQPSSYRPVVTPAPPPPPPEPKPEEIAFNAILDRAKTLVCERIRKKIESNFQTAVAREGRNQAMLQSQELIERTRMVPRPPEPVKKLPPVAPIPTPKLSDIAKLGPIPKIGERAITKPDLSSLGRIPRITDRAIAEKPGPSKASAPPPKRQPSPSSKQLRRLISSSSSRSASPEPEPVNKKVLELEKEIKSLTTKIDRLSRESISLRKIIDDRTRSTGTRERARNDRQMVKERIRGYSESLNSKQRRLNEWKLEAKDRPTSSKEAQRKEEQALLEKKRKEEEQKRREQERLEKEAKARAEHEAKMKAEAEAKLKAEAEAKAKAEALARQKATTAARKKPSKEPVSSLSSSSEEDSDESSSASSIEPVKKTRKRIISESSDESDTSSDTSSTSSSSDNTAIRAKVPSESEHSSRPPTPPPQPRKKIEISQEMIAMAKKRDKELAKQKGTAQKVEAKPGSSKKKPVKTTSSSSESSDEDSSNSDGSEYLPSDAKVTESKKPLAKAKQPVAAPEKAPKERKVLKAARTVKKKKVRKTRTVKVTKLVKVIRRVKRSKPKLKRVIAVAPPKKKRKVVTTRKVVRTKTVVKAEPEYEEETLRDFDFGHSDEVKAYNVYKAPMLSPEFWEDYPYAQEEERDFFVIPDAIPKQQGVRIRYSKRDRFSEYDLTMKGTVEELDEEEIIYTELAFNRVCAMGILPYSWAMEWRQPAYTPENEMHPEPIVKNDLAHYFVDPELQLVAPVPQGCIRLRGQMKYKREEKNAIRRLTVPTRLNLTDEDRQMVVNIKNEFRAENTLLRQLKTAGLDGLSLLTSNALASRPTVVTFAPSRIHDWGLFTLEEIKPRSLIIEYIGEVCRSTIVDVREQRYIKAGIGSSYLFRIDRNWVIDATRTGNSARFINHSCSPNSYARVVKGKHIAIYSKRLILAGEEITYDYKFPSEDEKIPCYCNAPNCRRYLN